MNFSPLTRTELQYRVDGIKSSIAWCVNACLERGDPFTDADTEYLRGLAADLREHHAADMARCAP